MGGGGSESSSGPLNAKKRAKIFQASLGNISGAVTPEGGIAGISTPQYVAPEMRTLSGGDYDALQQSLYEGSTAGLDRFADTERARIDQDLADRGLFQSGAAVEAQGRFSDALADQYARAGAGAASQRYGMQAQEQAMLNQLGLAGAQQQFQAGWAPLDYLAGLWGGTGGTQTTQESGSGGVLSGVGGLMQGAASLYGAF